MTQIRPQSEKPKHNFLQGIFFLLLICLATYIFLQSPIFDVKKIEINGRNRVPQEELVKLSGVVPGSNIFKLDLRIGEEKINMLPMIKNAKITRKFPSTVVITVEERVPVALLPLGKDFIEIDLEGVYLREGKINQSELPVITGCDIGEPVLGKKISGADIDIMLNVLNDLPTALLPRLSEIHVDDNNKIFIYTLERIQGRLGDPKEIEQKANVFLEVLNQVPEGKVVEYVDLTSFKSPVVKYRSPEV